MKFQLDETDDIYCRSYCLLNMFRAPLCPSSGAREYYTGGRCLWYLVLWFSSCQYCVELRVMCPGCSLQTGHITLSSTPCRQLENQGPNTTGSNHLYNILELLMMGIMVPETCWASNKFCNKNSFVASSWHFILFSLVYIRISQFILNSCSMPCVYVEKSNVPLIKITCPYCLARLRYIVQNLAP